MDTRMVSAKLACGRSVHDAVDRDGMVSKLRLLATESGRIDCLRGSRRHTRDPLH